MLTGLLLAVGIGLLLAGGTTLVQGASRIASGLGISPMIVGLTVVAFGTSSPELVVNVTGALQGESAIAFGNIVGSNLANLGLVLGAVSLIAPISIQGQLIQRELPLLLLATIVLVVMALDEPLRGTAAVLDRSEGLILLLLFGIFVYVSIMDFIRQRKDPFLLSAEQLPLPSVGAVARKDWILLITGMAALAIGGHLTISSGVEFAEQLGVSKTAVGLAIIAVGTSLPELVTSLIAALKKEADLSVGNVIGSNIFNGMMVLPIGAIISPVQVPAGGVLDLVVSLLFAAALIPVFVIGRSLMGRHSGLGFLLTYLIYIAYRTVSAV